MRRTAAERKADDRDAVKSNLQSMGLHGALRWAAKELSATPLPAPHKRRTLVLTIREAARQLQLDVAGARRLAAAHAVGLRQLGVHLAVLLALAAPAAAQSVVYTNVTNGQRGQIVKVVRVVQPAIPVPESIVTTPVLPRNWRPPLGASSYVPPVAPPPQPHSRRVPDAPWYINGIYVGQSPSGAWMSTTIGRPIVDVRIIDVPRRTK